VLRADQMALIFFKHELPSSIARGVVAVEEQRRDLNALVEHERAVAVLHRVRQPGLVGEGVVAVVAHDGHGVAGVGFALQRAAGLADGEQHGAAGASRCQLGTSSQP